MSRSILRKFPVLELSALVITLIVLLGTPANVTPLMTFTDAAAFIVAVACKLLLEYSDHYKPLNIWARLLAIGLILFGLLRMTGLALGVDAINNLFFEPYADVEFSKILISAFCFVLFGAACFRISRYGTEKIFIPHLLSVITFFIALLSMIAWFFSGNSFYGITIYRPMNIAASINFFLLSFSVLMVNKRQGFMGHLTGKYQGAKIARLLLPLAVAVPVLLGFFQLQSEKTGFTSVPYNIALLTLARIVVLVIFIWRTAVIVNRSHKAATDELDLRKKNEEALRYRKALLEAQNEATPDAILVVDVNGDIVSYNRHFLEIWQVPEAMMRGNKDAALLEFVTSQLMEPDRFLKQVQHLYANPNITGHDEIVFKDGRIVERFANPVVGDDGTNYGRAWYFRDITLNRKYEKRIENFTRELETRIKERTEELDKSEKRFRLLVENSLDIISLIDRDGNLIYISPSIERLTGFTEKDMIGHSGFDLIHPDDVEGGKKFREKLLSMPGVADHSSFRLKHRNGDYIWVEGTVTNMLENKNVRAFVLNYHDITERKKAEEEIQKSEKRFRSLIENAQDIISLSDRDGNRFYISPSIEKITGYTVEESINRSVFDIVHPDDIERSKSQRQTFLAAPGVKKPLSFRFKKKDGGVVWMEGTVVNMLDDENVRAVVGNYHDVTEKKMNEERIRVTTERFEILSKATHDTVWDWDLETDKIYWNDEICTMFNYDPSDITAGRDWKMHIHPEDFRRVTRKIIYYINNRQQNWQDEYRFRCADGSYKYVFNRGFILYNSAGPYRIIGAMQDVTEINMLQQSLVEERIKKQRELTNATIEGQEKERSGIGRELHDNVNQLLTATKLYLDVAATQPAMKDEMIKRSTENLNICMEEIRKLSSSLVAPSLGINRFEDIVQDLLEPIRLATPMKVSYEVKDVDNEVLSDEQRLNIYRIIQEHLNNIIKHSAASHVSISVKQLNGTIDINIKDDGQGFNTGTRRKGIGLKNIQSRAELLHGRMDVVSRPGKGCLLQVTFPVSSPERTE